MCSLYFLNFFSFWSSHVNFPQVVPVNYLFCKLEFSRVKSVLLSKCTAPARPCVCLVFISHCVVARTQRVTQTGVSSQTQISKVHRNEQQRDVRCDAQRHCMSWPKTMRELDSHNRCACTHLRSECCQAKLRRGRRDLKPDWLRSRSGRGLRQCVYKRALKTLRQCFAEFSADTHSCCTYIRSRLSLLFYGPNKLLWIHRALLIYSSEYR